MTTVVYLRTNRSSGAAERISPRELLVDGGSVSANAETPVALDEHGPFRPLAEALGASGPLRDAFARTIPVPCLRGHRRTRFGVLAMAAVPMAMLLELDRELVSARNASAGRIVIDLVLVAFVLYELSRRTPRMPGIAALSLVAIALRWTLVATRLCGHGVPLLVYAAAALSAGAGVVLLARAPSRERVTLELLNKLGVSRSDLSRATRPKEPPGALVAAAVACAAGLPAALHLVRAAGGGIHAQAALALTFAAFAQPLARRMTEPDAPGPERVAPKTILSGAAVGLSLTAAAVMSARLFFDNGAEIARCVERLDAELRVARAVESAELARAIDVMRAHVPLVALTAVVFPFAEERIYRGLLQDVLARRYGRLYGIFAASVAFAIAHLGVYELALYQTVLLGIGFGVAFAEGGLLAALVAHGMWNVVQLI